MQPIHRALTRAHPGVALVAAALSLLLAEPAAGHLTPEPTFVEAGGRQRIVLTVHNDRDAEMTGFRLSVPEGFRILETGGDEGWSASREAASATWTGGKLAPFEPVTFEVDLEAAGVEPGPATLRGDQLYPDGNPLSWPVVMTVVPAGESPPGEEGIGTTAIAILGVLGALVVASFVVVFWVRRRST